MEKFYTCNLCCSSDLLELVHFGDYPIMKHYLKDKDQIQPVFPMNLQVCKSCGLTQLVDSCPPELLYDNYVTLSSWKSQPQIQDEINLLMSLDGMSKDSKIFEIGCNDGVFFDKFAESGFTNFMGIEPTKDSFNIARSKGYNVINDYLNVETAQSIRGQYGTFDLLMARHVLEHISDLPNMIKSIDLLLSDNGYILIEVPNFERCLESYNYALWEEHVNYFTFSTMKHYLSQIGINIVHEDSIVFSGEAILVIGRKTNNIKPNLTYLDSLIAANLNYAQQWPIFKSIVQGYFKAEKEKGKKIAVYGAGSSTFCLLSFLEVADYIDLVLDDQKEKQNLFSPWSKLPIVSGEALYEANIVICFLAVNVENESKVILKHHKWVSDGGLFWSLIPPSRLLPPFWKNFIQN
jgi:2-polyprenyl-3-methyl-5-hydroxy-6-metoxy-1,4-benzoquinol methylase